MVISMSQRLGMPDIPHNLAELFSGTSDLQNIFSISTWFCLPRAKTNWFWNVFTDLASGTGKALRRGTGESSSIMA